MSSQDDLIGKMFSHSVSNPPEGGDWRRSFKKIMMEWIELNWKMEQAHQNGEPYTRLKFESNANEVERKILLLFELTIEQELQSQRKELWIDFREHINLIQEKGK